jgi:hypothetical protein
MVLITKLAALASRGKPNKQVQSDLGLLHARLRMIHQQGPFPVRRALSVQKTKNGLIAGGVALALLGSYLAWDRLQNSNADGLAAKVPEAANVS